MRIPPLTITWISKWQRLQSVCYIVTNWINQVVCAYLVFVWIGLIWCLWFALRFAPFFFFHAFQRQNMYSSRNFLLFRASVDPVHCSQDPQTSLFINFFIKNGSHGTIHAFKNYFATVFSVFNFRKISFIQMDP